MLESTLTKEEIETAKKNVSEIKEKMNPFFTSKDLEETCSSDHYDLW